MKLTMKQAVLALALVGIFTTANATVLTPKVVSGEVDTVLNNSGGTSLYSATTAINIPSYNGFDMFVDRTELSDNADRTTPSVIGFSFEPDGTSKVVPGNSSHIKIIRANARDYVAGNFGQYNGYGDNAVDFSPATPEPETFAMILAGLGLIGFIGSRRLSQADSWL